MSTNQSGPIFQTKSPFDATGGSGVVPPFFFTRGGTNPTGTYLKVGDVVTSDTGQSIPGLNYIVKLVAALSDTVATTTRIQFTRRTGVSSWADITNGYIDIPAGEYTATRTGIVIAIGPDAEVGCYIKSGSSCRNPIVGIFVVPQ